jgi:hypothetical protein
MGTTAAWVEGMRGRSVLEVARALGLHVSERKPGWVSPCPACGRERRNASTPGEKRGAVGVRRDGGGWKCFPCGASGDALGLVAYQLGGAKLGELSDARKAEVREWCSRFLGLDTSAPTRRAAAPLRRVRPPEPERTAEPVYPPAEELAAVWAACVPVTDDPVVSGYLGGLHILPAEVARLDLARALPASATCPAWAGTGEGARWRSWAAQGARLVVPLVDAHGAMRSVLARFPWKVEKGTKSLAAKGYVRSGLVLANDRARAWLDKTNAPPGPCLVLEGEKDYLLTAVGPAWGKTWADTGVALPAAFGVFSGSWSRPLADRIPDGSHVAIATDDNPTGEAYAREIGESLAARVVAGRLRAERRRPTKAEEGTGP